MIYLSYALTNLSKLHDNDGVSFICARKHTHTHIYNIYNAQQKKIQFTTTKKYWIHFSRLIRVSMVFYLSCVPNGDDDGKRFFLLGIQGECVSFFFVHLWLISILIKSNSIGYNIVGCITEFYCYCYCYCF